MTDLERVREVVNWLLFNKTIKSRRELAEKMGYTESSMSQILNGKVSLSEKFIKNLSIIDKTLNIDWLMTGEGKMLKSDEKESPPDVPRISYTEGVPYYDVDFIGGFDLVMNDQTTAPAYNIDFAKYNNADFWCNVSGHSMSPEISHGDIIAIKELNDWRTFLPLGEVYAIVTTEHRTIKKVTSCDDADSFLLIPINKSEEFRPQIIPKAIILKIYKVLGCMKKM